MKGGLAVMIEVARWAEGADLGYDLGLLFFPREEVGPDENPLPGLFAATPVIDEAALVICLEPTDNTIQLGCLGNLNARVVFEGRAAHSARPWLGVNAHSTQGRLVVGRVTPGSPAEKTGLKRGDIIAGVNGERTRTLGEFYRKLWAAGPAGTTVTLEVLSDTDPHRVPVQSVNRLDTLKLQSTF